MHYRPQTSTQLTPASARPLTVSSRHHVSSSPPSITPQPSLTHHPKNHPIILSSDAWPDGTRNSEHGNSGDEQ
eukprot:381044-Pyramimonas_sp.AAC.1